MKNTSNSNNSLSRVGNLGRKAAIYLKVFICIWFAISCNLGVYGALGDDLEKYRASVGEVHSEELLRWALAFYLALIASFNLYLFNYARRQLNKLSK